MVIDKKLSMDWLKDTITKADQEKKDAARNAAALQRRVDDLVRKHSPTIMPLLNDVSAAVLGSFLSIPYHRARSFSKGGPKYGPCWFVGRVFKDSEETLYGGVVVELNIEETTYFVTYVTAHSRGSDEYRGSVTVSDVVGLKLKLKEAVSAIIRRKEIHGHPW